MKSSQRYAMNTIDLSNNQHQKTREHMSPRTEETNARIREEQKERILEAAKAIFAHKGFSETKMSDIAAAANVSYGLTYHYFTNKEAIFSSLLQEALQGALKLMQDARVQPGTPWDRLRWLTTAILRGP